MTNRTTTDYTEFDALLIESIKESAPIQFFPLSVLVRKEADALAKSDRRGDIEGWRVVDRRLQALRKRGSIAWGPRGWRLA